MAAFEYGTDVLVAARVARVIGDMKKDGRVAYFQSLSRRDAGRFHVENFDDTAGWPGEPVPLEWNEASPSFELSPEVRGTLVRLRRMPYRRPKSGIVIGATNRQEGRVLGGGEDDVAHLAGPGRRVDLLEVALVPAARGKAEIVLVHPRDCILLGGPA